jgi:hypothetical protein
VKRRPPTKLEREEARQLLIQDAQRHPWLAVGDWNWNRWLSEGTVEALLSSADIAEQTGASIQWVTAVRTAAKVLAAKKAERAAFEQANTAYLEAERILREKREVRDRAYAELVRKPEGGLR